MVAKGIGALSALPNKKKDLEEKKDESRTSNESKRWY